MKIQYLEIVTPDVDTFCAVYSAVHNLSFGDPVAELGQAHTADMPGGGRVGVRAPMHEDEKPVTRPYVLVEDIHAAVKDAESKGATTIHPPLEIPGQGTFAICLTGGIEHAFWQL